MISVFFFKTQFNKNIIIHLLCHVRLTCTHYTLYILIAHTQTSLFYKHFVRPSARAAPKLHSPWLLLTNIRKFKNIKIIFEDIFICVFLKFMNESNENRKQIIGLELIMTNKKSWIKNFNFLNAAVLIWTWVLFELLLCSLTLFLNSWII